MLFGKISLDKNRSLGLIDTKICKNRKMKIFFIQLPNAWLHFTNNNFPIPMSIEKIIDQFIFLNPHTKLEVNSDSPYFYYIPPKNNADNFTIVRDLCRFCNLV